MQNTALRLVFTLLVCLWSCAASATPLQMSGFESGDSASVGPGNEFRSMSGTFSYSTTTVRTGTYALRINPNTTSTGSVRIGALNANGSTTSTVELSVADLYSTFYFRAATLPASSEEEIATVIDTAGAAKSQLRITSTGALKWCDAALSCTSAA